MKNTVGSDKSTILVPIDYSECSILACRYAAKIANKSNSEICLFHAFYSPAFDLIELTGGAQTQKQLKADVTEKLLEDEVETMENFVNKLFEMPQFKLIKRDQLRFELKAGLAKNEILSFSTEIKPLLVVMGTHGTSTNTGSVLGSITEYAIKQLNVPVIAIPANYKFIGEEKLQRIVYLTNFDESDFASIAKLMRFTKFFNMSIHCIHIGQSKEKWEKVKMDGLKQYFHSVYDNKFVECHIVEGKDDIVNAIDSYVSEHQINIISLTHKKRKLLEKVFRPSVAKKIFYHSELPLMVFHG